MSSPPPEYLDWLERDAERARLDQILSGMLAQLSPGQLDLRHDPAKYITTVCTRQSGKTSDIVLDAIDRTVGKPGGIVYGILPTRDRARDTIWDRWKSAAALFGATEENHNETRLETRIPGGGIFRLVGAPDIKRADRVRGQVLDAILIDEASNFPEHVLKYLVEECATAALGIKDGVLRIYSTPGPNPEGYLYKLYTDRSLGFSRHFLSLADNPAWKDPIAYLARIRKAFGYSEDDPTYQREWLGKWVADFSARVYRIADENLVDAPGDCDYTVMALDLGATDESAISVLGWRHGSRMLHALVDEAESDMDLTSVAERVKALQAEYKPLVTMVDGAAKQSVLELQNRHGIPLEATPKSPGYKPKAIGQLNADFKRGLVLVPRSFEVVGQMRALQWAEKARGVRENQNQPNDRCDAFLYAYLRACHYTEHEEAAKPKEGTPEWWAAEQQRVRDEHVKAHQPRDVFDPWATPSDSPWKV